MQCMHCQCIKRSHVILTLSDPCAAATRKKSVGSGEGDGGLKLSKKDESPYMEMKLKPDGINVDLNPAYQSKESAMYA